MTARKPVDPKAVADLVTFVKDHMRVVPESRYLSDPSMCEDDYRERIRQLEAELEGLLEGL